MNFVVFSWHFLPENNAEGYCTSRFVNALMQAGHGVHVVTREVPKIVDDAVVRQILPSGVKVTRIKEPTRSILRRISGRLYAHEYASSYYGAYVEKLRQVLMDTSDPILVSRGLPMASNLVAYACRKYAKKWIAHFSDPAPYGLLGENDCGTTRKVSFINRIVDWLVRYRVSQIVKESDGVSITCSNFLDFFKTRYARDYDTYKDKFFETPHIGDPALRPREQKVYGGNGFVISHVGYLAPERYVTNVLQELAKFAEDGRSVKFLLLGLVDPSALKHIKSASIELEYVKSSDPGESTNVANSSDACLVIDSKTTYGFSPFLPSKLVYLLFQDKPIIAYCLPGSAMHKLSVNYPDAGIFWANPEEDGSLANALRRVAGMKEQLFERSVVRRTFGPTEVADNFCKFVNKDNILSE